MAKRLHSQIDTIDKRTKGILNKTPNIANKWLLDRTDIDYTLYGLPYIQYILVNPVSI